MRARAVRLATVGFGVMVLGAWSAHAEPPIRTLSITPPPCVSPVDVALFAEAARVELREMGVDRVDVSASPGAGAALSLGPDCDPAAFALRLRLTSADVVPNRERLLDLMGLPDEARPRAAAIALAEMLRTALENPAAEGRLGESAPLPPEERPGVPRAVASGRRPGARPHRMSVGALGRMWLDARTIHVGPRADVRLAVAAPLDVVVGGGSLFSSARDPLGDVSSTTLFARAGASFVHAAPPLLVDVGPVLEAGGFLASASTVRRDVVAQDASAPVLGAALTGGAEVTPVEPLRLRLELELGGSLVGKRTIADGRETPSYSGVEASLSVSAGLAL